MHRFSSGGHRELFQCVFRDSTICGSRISQAVDRSRELLLRLRLDRDDGKWTEILKAVGRLDGIIDTNLRELWKDYPAVRETGAILEALLGQWRISRHLNPGGLYSPEAVAASSSSRSPKVLEQSGKKVSPDLEGVEDPSGRLVTLLKTIVEGTESAGADAAVSAHLHFRIAIIGTLILMALIGLIG